MPDFVQIAVRQNGAFAPKPRRAVLWLQAITLAWMLVELSVAAWSAVTAHSPALLAFASDSLVELLSALVVLSQWIPSIAIPERTAARASGALLFALAFVVAAIAVTSARIPLAARDQLRRHRHHHRRTRRHAHPGRAQTPRSPPQRQPGARQPTPSNRQRCAYLAFITLTGSGTLELGLPPRVVRLPLPRSRRSPSF